MSCVPKLLLPGVSDRLREAYRRYPQQYDDVLHEVHDRLVTRGSATKLDLAALIAWKHIQTADWMTKLLKTAPDEVEKATSAAFAGGITDEQRVESLRPLQGFHGGGAFTSVVLTAWDPSRFAVYDKVVNRNRPRVFSADCTCDWQHLPIYWDHVRRTADELRGADLGDGIVWTPRDVEMALFNWTSVPG